MRLQVCRLLTFAFPLAADRLNAFNRRFLAAALARIKNIANGLYAACEVQRAFVPAVLASHIT